MQIIDRLGQALFMAWSMWWEILWALVLGFALSGIVQAAVSHQSLAKALGGFAEKPDVGDPLWHRLQLPRIAQRANEKGRKGKISDEREWHLAHLHLALFPPPCLLYTSRI